MIQLLSSEDSMMKLQFLDDNQVSGIIQLMSPEDSKVRLLSTEDSMFVI